jgi:hypothetical protein
VTGVQTCALPIWVFSFLKALINPFSTFSVSVSFGSIIDECSSLRKPYRFDKLS